MVEEGRTWGQESESERHMGSPNNWRFFVFAQLFCFVCAIVG